MAANWSSIWYMLSAFAVISYTENAVYVAFAAAGSWLGAFLEKSAIVELADTALRRIEKVDRRLQAYRDRVNGGAA